MIRKFIAALALLSLGACVVVPVGGRHHHHHDYDRYYYDRR